ncbi:myoglobin-like [Mercenaria mercenaria]|uniref:myoglobin-like n=1 Tax=Mercenaria mercenaria TaxID=6596 RepID=UPI00234EADA3|nr:myoglobin-like [Mercenaria mercenaria]
MGCIHGILRQRKFAKVGAADTKSARPKDLSDAQKAAIRNNWNILKSQVANIGVFTFIGMFESRPELKETFATFKDKNVDELQYTGLLRNHALRVMTTIDKCISRLDQPSSMISTLRKIGVHHTLYKVPVEYLEV